MTFVRIIALLALAFLVLIGVACSVMLATGIQTANTPVYCWSQHGVTGVVYSPTWEEQAYARLRSSAGVDPSVLTDFYTIKEEARDADGNWTTVWAWPYAIEQEKHVQCNRDSVNWQWENAALWNKGTWIGYSFGILLGVLAVVALSAFGCRVASELSDTYDWCDAIDIALCLAGIVWPVGIVVAVITGLVYAVKLTFMGALKVGVWIADL